MFNTNSDYSLNKRDKDSIIYISATGNPVLLTRADFSSEDEFLHWKLWSDGDYKTTEQSGRDFYDNCISLDESLDCIGAVSSIEDELISRINEAEYDQHHIGLMERVKSILTRKQYRRLWMRHVDGLILSAIAIAENVSEPSVSESISRAKKNIFKYFRKTL